MASDFAGAGWRSIASSVLRRSLGLQRGQSVLIETWTYALPAAEVIAQQARELGVHPTVLYAPEEALVRTPGAPRKAKGAALSRTEVAAVKACDGYVFLPPSVEDQARLDRLPSVLRRHYLSRREELWELLLRYSVPSVYLLAALATDSAARKLGVEPRRWQQEAARASVVPRESLDRVAKLVEQRLRRGHTVTITHPTGTHLELGLLGRLPVIDDGVVDQRALSTGRAGTVVPGGCVSVALDESHARGTLVGEQPNPDRRGGLKKVRWSFENGRLTEIRAASGRDFSDEAYQAAGPERDRPAILVVGLNPELHDFPFAEDQERGVVSVLVGYNDDFGGRTRGSYRQLALVRGATLLVDDRVLVQSGRLR